jgi:tRNA pseudouridine38-40 synthase
MKYKLLLSYDGTAYSGWQVQKNGTSIQLLIEKALSTLLRHPTSLVGAGRTDAGVHALGQVAHFTTESALDIRKALISLNGLLPSAIRALHLEPASSDFHARYSAKGKIYRYDIELGPYRNPFTQNYRLFVPYPLDLNLLKTATLEFIGERDFTSFSNEADRGSAAKNPIRTLYCLELLRDGNTLSLQFFGNGFLYKMVRNIVGTLLDVARGKISLETIPAIFAAKDRRRACPTAPAHGLFLIEVLY